MAISGQVDEPAASNGFHLAHARLLCETHLALTGRQLLPDSGARLGYDLYQAPFAVLSHDNAADPVFSYANLTAQRLFNMGWSEFVQLPSRYSAEQPDRQEREALLAAVTQRGYIEDYRGIRVTKQGERFLIRNAVVWNLQPNNRYLGQAAMFSDWQPCQ